MKTISIAAAALMTTAAVACAPAFAAGDMTQQLDYFHAHSFDFPQNFRFQHPGPAWILKHADDLKLTEEQTTKLKKLSSEMFSDMDKYNKRTQEANDKYAKDASVKMPSEIELKRDIEKVGMAEDELAYTMIPFHLKSYELLNSEQKKTFDDLVAKGEGKK